jgi:hypothetical protein
LKKQKIAVWGFLVAAGLLAIAGLRDIFAPGFFSMSGRVMSNSEIALEFAVAAMFFILAVSFSRRHPQGSNHN